MSRGARIGSSAYLQPAPPRVIAHRGLALEAPENTLLAFLHALNIGVTHLETDVHGSRDAVAVVSHDPDLSRVAGRPGQVSELTMAELRRVPLGQDQGYCSLEELLDGFPDARVNIDIKSADAIGPAISAIRRTRAENRVLIGSFSGSRRTAVVRALPGVATSVSSFGALVAVAAATAGLTPLVRRALHGVDATQLPVRVLGMRVDAPRAIRAIHAAGAEAHFWTINDPEQMRTLLDAGADGIVTDRADLAMAVLRGRTGTPDRL
ncbi:glycerophosphodiester phosphodiesterase [Schumannella luteola]|uniref:Glycerophosphoryl diester phosphodiesterase n=1 Tax=Schumannella luteola TaxID=472059 RepID=A0A852YBL6_9MICO|nr:glycerophosphoryl diester phosphodiesterase [Schumannella luteola]